jgi:hypothetical protein
MHKSGEIDAISANPKRSYRRKRFTHGVAIVREFTDIHGGSVHAAEIRAAAHSSGCEIGLSAMGSFCVIASYGNEGAPASVD